MIQAYVLLGTLGIHSIEDIRQKKITVMITLFSGIIGILLHIWFQNRSIYEMLSGVLAGVCILLFGRLTNGGIGAGDGILFMLTGLYLGLPENITLMLLSFTLAGVYGLCQVVIKNKSQNEKIPFAPFLFLGYFLMLVLR